MYIRVTTETGEHWVVRQVAPSTFAVAATFINLDDADDYARFKRQNGGPETRFQYERGQGAPPPPPHALAALPHPSPAATARPAPLQRPPGPAAWPGPPPEDDEPTGSLEPIYPEEGGEEDYGEDAHEPDEPPPAPVPAAPTATTLPPSPVEVRQGMVKLLSLVPLEREVRLRMRDKEAVVLGYLMHRADSRGDVVVSSVAMRASIGYSWYICKEAIVRLTKLGCVTQIQPALGRRKAIYRVVEHLRLPRAKAAE